MKSRLYISVIVVVIVLCLVLSGSAFAAELTARIFSGEAKSARSGRTWAVNLKIIDYNNLSGNFVGQTEWPSLNSIHRIEGHLIGARFTFKETEAMLFFHMPDDKTILRWRGHPFDVTKPLKKILPA